MRRPPVFNYSLLSLFSRFVETRVIWVQVLDHTRCPLKQELLEHWTIHSEADAAMAADAGSMLFVEIAHSEFKIELTINSEIENISVIRWQFPLTHGMLRTAYAAQGLTLEGGVIMDLRRAGGLEDDDWWLAIYVMISRARKLENIILLGFTEQVEDLLRRGPPANLVNVTEKLEEKAASTLDRLSCVH